jgi:hypothetical protein
VVASTVTQSRLSSSAYHIATDVVMSVLLPQQYYLIEISDSNETTVKRGDAIAALTLIIVSTLFD